MMQPSDSFEIGVSPQYSHEYQWTSHAITGFLSAYYMEDPRFRLLRKFHDLETGVYVWVCEGPGEKFVRRLLKRLQFDIPPCQIFEKPGTGVGLGRWIIDLQNPNAANG